MLVMPERMVSTTPAPCREVGERLGRQAGAHGSKVGVQPQQWQQQQQRRQQQRQQKKSTHNMDAGPVLKPRTISTAPVNSKMPATNRACFMVRARAATDGANVLATSCEQEAEDGSRNERGRLRLGTTNCDEILSTMQIRAVEMFQLAQGPALRSAPISTGPGGWAVANLNHCRVANHLHWRPGHSRP